MTKWLSRSQPAPHVTQASEVQQPSPAGIELFIVFAVNPTTIQYMVEMKEQNEKKKKEDVEMYIVMHLRV